MGFYRKANRNLVELLEVSEFNCPVKGCEQTFEYDQRKKHLLTECVLAQRLSKSCPFGCSIDCADVIQNDLSLEEHVDKFCTSDKMNCSECGENVYKQFKDADFDKL